MGMERSLLANDNLSNKMGGKEDNDINVYDIAGSEKVVIHQGEG